MKTGKPDFMGVVGFSERKTVHLLISRYAEVIELIPSSPKFKFYACFPFSCAA